jgi:hypothetical protein
VFTESTVKRVREHVCLRKAAYIVSEKEDLIENFGLYSGNESDSDSDSIWSDETESSLDETDVAFSNDQLLSRPSPTALADSKEEESNRNCFISRPKFIVSLEFFSESDEWAVTAQTMPYVTTKSPLELAPDVLEIFEMEYFTDQEYTHDKENELTRRVICVYTEAMVNQNVTPVLDPFMILELFRATSQTFQIIKTTIMRRTFPNYSEIMCHVEFFHSSKILLMAYQKHLSINVHDEQSGINNGTLFLWSHGHWSPSRTSCSCQVTAPIMMNQVKMEIFISPFNNCVQYIPVYHCRV